MKAFSLSTQQHPDGGLVLTMSAHCMASEQELIASIYALADTLSGKVTPAPERGGLSGQATEEPGYYNQFASGTETKPALEIEHGEASRPRGRGTTKR